MNKFILLFFALYLTGCALSPNSAEVPAPDNYAVMAPVFDPAETFFASLKERKYGTAWEFLSAKSRKAIINEIYEAIEKTGGEMDISAVVDDFEKGGPLFEAFWNSYLGSFDPDLVLETSRWEMGFIDGDKAEIIILYKKSDNPARLKMFKENGGWKFGLTESFWGRKYLNHKEF